MLLRVIFNTLFGLSVNFWMAVITRFLLGSLNGLLGPIKVRYYDMARIQYLLIWFDFTAYLTNGYIYVNLYKSPGVCSWNFSRGAPSLWPINCKILSTFFICISSLNFYFTINFRSISQFQVSTSWGIGLIIGPALGGFLAQVLPFLFLSS